MKRFYLHEEEFDSYIVFSDVEDDFEASHLLPEWFPPVKVSLEPAEFLAKHFEKKLPGTKWTVKLAPEDCPKCRAEVYADDHDFLYPLNRERTKWNAVCQESTFGCGFKVTGETMESVLEEWNRLSHEKHTWTKELIDKVEKLAESINKFKKPTIVGEQE